MLLKKPCYGQLDAPRRWFLEACRRLRGLGLRQHVLDPCTFLIFEKDFGVSEFSPGAVGDCGLVGIFASMLMIYLELVMAIRRLTSTSSSP